MLEGATVALFYFDQLKENDPTYVPLLFDLILGSPPFCLNPSYTVSWDSSPNRLANHCEIIIGVCVGGQYSSYL